MGGMEGLLSVEKVLFVPGEGLVVPPHVKKREQISLVPYPLVLFDAGGQLPHPQEWYPHGVNGMVAHLAAW